jgi:hypothetical protein
MPQEPDLPPVLPSPGPREFAHKLNNLLTVVLAQAESSLASGDPEDMRRALEVIVATSGTMADAVRAYAKTAPGRHGQSVEGRLGQDVEGR